MTEQLNDGSFQDEKRVESSVFTNCSQNQQVPPQQLSGDQNAERSVLLSDVQSGKSNFLLSVTTVMKTVIGAGIISLPYTVSKLGYVLSLFFFGCIIISTHLSIDLLVRVKNLSRHSNYASIFSYILRKRRYRAIGSLLILLNNLGICIAQLLIFKATIRYIILENELAEETTNAFYTSKLMVVLIVAVVEIPFILASKIEKLKVLALLGVSGVVVFIVSLIAHFITTMSEREWVVVGMNAFPNDALSAISVLPNIFLAFAFQMNFFPIYKGVKNVTDHKITRICLTATISCATAYLTVAFLGCILYNQSPHFEADFLLSVPLSTTNPFLYYLMNGGFLLSVLLSFPIMFFGARNNFIALAQLLYMKKFEPGQWRNNIQMISSFIDSEDKKKRDRKAYLLFLLYTFILYAVIITVAILVDDIQIVFNAVGAICSSSISCILPGLFYLLLIQKKKKQHTSLYYFSIIFSPLVAVLCLTAIVAKNLRD